MRPDLVDAAPAESYTINSSIVAQRHASSETSRTLHATWSTDSERSVTATVPLLSENDHLLHYYMYGSLRIDIILWHEMFSSILTANHVSYVSVL